MTSQARIDANRRNATRSTGPRTEEGKAKARLNALKHGAAAETVVLPHEDAAAYERRLDAWTRELAPRGEARRYLAERAVRLSWQLDRADAHERAVLSRRAREAPRERERSRRRRAAELLRLVLSADPPEVGPAMLHLDEPSTVSTQATARLDRLARLEASAHGCRALLEAWTNIDADLASAPVTAEPNRIPGGWVRPIATRTLRLLGFSDETEARASKEPRARRVADLTGAASNHARDAVLNLVRFASSDGPDTPCPISPFDEDAARREFRQIVAAEQVRLRESIDAHEIELPHQAAEDMALASFDHSAKAERVHRYQNQWGRALMQAIKHVASLPGHVEDAPSYERVNEACSVAMEASQEPVADLTPAGSASVPERTQSSSVNQRSSNDLRQDPASRSRARQGGELPSASRSGPDWAVQSRHQDDSARLELSPRRRRHAPKSWRQAST